MKKLSVAVLIAGVALATVIAGCGGGGGGSSSGGNTVPGELIITGHVMNTAAAPVRLDQVVITMVTLLGTRQATTDINGKFSIDFGPNVAVASLFASQSDAVFTVDTHVLSHTNYPASYVFYPHAPTDPGFTIADKWSGDNWVATVSIPTSVANAVGVTADLGNIYIPWNDPNQPPISPF